jgi:CGNR zinc finger/Putative stress-induced transcription regulator
MSLPVSSGTIASMAAVRLPQPVHERDDSSPAPGELELLRSFLSLHDHEEGNPEDNLPPSSDSIRWWLTTNGLLPEDARPRRSELLWASRVRSALVDRVRGSMGEPVDPGSARVLDRAADRAGLRPRFDDPDRRIEVGSTGVRGAIGRLLGLAFLAELDGRWDRFRLCDDPSCRSVFYDGSRNRTGKWCSMSVCGNRAKVRAFRRRRAAG